MKEKSGTGGGGFGPADCPPPPQEISGNRNTTAKAKQNKVRARCKALRPNLLQFIYAIWPTSYYSDNGQTPLQAGADRVTQTSSRVNVLGHLSL
jgi:hypothetical protein